MAGKISTNKGGENKIAILSYPQIFTYVLSAQKTVLLSTLSICFGSKIRKLIFNNNTLQSIRDTLQSDQRVC